MHQDALWTLELGKKRNFTNFQWICHAHSFCVQQFLFVFQPNDLPSESDFHLQEENPTDGETEERNDLDTDEITLSSQRLVVSPSLSSMEEEVVTYIGGATVHSMKTKKDGKCLECMALLDIKASKPNIFISLKNYTEGALTNITPPLQRLAFTFETFFKNIIDEALVSPHPRAHILSSFHSSMPDFSLLQCSEHGDFAAKSFLNLYSINRIFFAVKLINQRIRAGRKGSELNKCKKWNF
ncbi:hypothetical protein CAPTEDRAFT_207320 [Capitella teleta]|uniref:Uncharacterized protein n=1 Tax=Capitella teleta TaxID=283909 RepID=R7TE73_CAPTE|nr:hypothetical protein CAPTEDRAFT_207320 [Capitella teleta]|eukprot:ELT89356.1 hypothetical protein CAPTEDRAFT_207320 [Capitella teleta]